MSREDLELKLRHLFMESMKGDVRSYEMFLDLSTVLIRRYLKHLSGKFTDAESIEDLVQEILLTLHQKKHTYQVDRQLLPWMYAVAKHRYIDFYRSKKRLPGTVSIDPELEKTLAKDEKEEILDMGEIMTYLTPKQQEMLYLIKVEGASYEEAAKSLSMSVSAVKVGIHRILKSLKGKVDNEK